MIAQIQMRRGTTAEWAAAAPVILSAGEPGYDTTLKRVKMGDGATAFSALEWNTLLPYPVGSIYMSVVSTSPATLFGGTWSAWGAGRVPVGIDAGQTEFDTVEETGGAKTHTLSVAELAIHNHGGKVRPVGTAQTGISSEWNGTRFMMSSAVGGEATPLTATIPSAGSGTAHNNLQPYIVCYMWKRTA